VVYGCDFASGFDYRRKPGFGHFLRFFQRLNRPLPVSDKSNDKNFVVP
jgi:hypothetical protein